MTESLHVGDDVVDLGERVNATAHMRPRFVARVCCADEQARVAASGEPSALLWSLFAAKEAAFKAISKLRPPIAFGHREFVVSPDLRSVQYRDLTAAVQVTRDGDCVHAVAIIDDSETALDDRGVETGVRRVENDSDLSSEARRLLCEHLAPRLDCDAGELDVYREPARGSWTGFGPPILRRAGRPTGGDISLSHDGRFVSFAAVSRPQP